MTPESMMIEAFKAIKAGSNMTLVRKPGTKLPPNFPRGELLCENFDGLKCYSHDPRKILKWLSDNRLVDTKSMDENPSADLL